MGAYVSLYIYVVCVCDFFCVRVCVWSEMLEQCVCEMREQCVGEFSITFTEGTKSEGEREREKWGYCAKALLEWERILYIRGAKNKLLVRKKQRESVNSLGTKEGGGGTNSPRRRTFSTTPEIYSNLSRKFSSFY